MLAGTNQLVRNACQKGLAVPAFNTPCRPMMEPAVRAARDTETFALITAAGAREAVCEATVRVIREELEGSAQRINLEDVSG